MPGGNEPRLVRRPLSWRLSREAVLRLVRSDPHPVALFGGWAGGADIVASEPVTVRSAPWSPDQVFDPGLPALPDQEADGAVPAFGGGWIGYLGYSAAGEALPASGPRVLPSWWFGHYDHVLRRDRATGEWFFEALWTAGRAGAIEARLAELDRRAAAAAEDPGAGQGCEFGPFQLVPGAARHIEAVRAAVEYIRRGDIFQANVTLRAQAEYSGDPLDAFCRGVAALDPPYAAFVSVSARTGGDAQGRAAVASLSPELFLRRVAGTVASKPIKGTARRDGGADEAAAQRAALEASAKNRAENVMIVDLVRADLSRVCVAGSVTVPVLLGPEPHPGVWHLVSTVTGTLHEGTTDGDLIRAAFPPGSVTGAPKVRALEIIDELEAAPREVYTGAIGYRSPAAGLELNVAIRTFEFAPGRGGAPGRAWLGAGGGIVADSDPAAEYAECLIKATPLLTAIGARLDTGPTDPAATGDASTAATAHATAEAGGAALRPHPAAGVFSSLTVTRGVTRGLDAHLARLTASVRALYGKELPGSLRDDLASCLAAGPTGRLRISVRPVGGPLQATVEVVPLTPRPAAVLLRPVAVPGGIGAHKYRDRRLLASLVGRRRRIRRAGAAYRRDRRTARDRQGERVRGHRRRAAHPARRRPPAARHHPGRRAPRGARARRQDGPEAAHPRRARRGERGVRDQRGGRRAPGARRHGSPPRLAGGPGRRRHRHRPGRTPARRPRAPHGPGRASGPARSACSGHPGGSGRICDATPHSLAHRGGRT